MTILKLLDGTKAYVHAVIDNFPAAFLRGLSLIASTR